MRGCLSGFTPVSIHLPVSVFFLPHDCDISSFVHLLPPNSTVDKKAPSPLVVFCANSNANANVNVNNVLFVLPSNQYVPSPTSSPTAVSLYRSVALARIPHSTPPILLEARRQPLLLSNENLKICRPYFYPCDGRARNSPGEVVDLVERVRFEIRYLHK